MSYDIFITKTRARKKMSNPVVELLHGTDIRSVSRLMDLVTVSGEHAVEEAVKLMNQHGILSVPVVKGEGDESHELVGMLDMLDLSHFLLSVLPDEITTREDLERAGRAMAFKPTSQVVNVSGRDPPTPLNFHQPLTLALKLFASGIHRVPITNSKEELVGLLSQFDLVKFLSTTINRGHCKHMAHQTLQQLGLGQSELISSPPTDSVLSFIRRLDSHEVSGIALVDPETNQLVGNFSVTDLRGLWHELLPTFHLSAREYLEQHHPTSLKVEAVPIETTTLEQVIHLMYQNHHHRVWTTRDSQLFGVVTITDLCRLFRDYQLEVN